MARSSAQPSLRPSLSSLRPWLSSLRPSLSSPAGGLPLLLLSLSRTLCE